MDNPELIKRLINFDEDDTSTGFVGVTQEQEKELSEDAKLSVWIESEIRKGVPYNQIFKEVHRTSQGLKRVCTHEDKWNYLTPDLKILSRDLWFGFVYNFNKGFGIVEIYSKLNYLTSSGNILYDKLPDEWFDDCWDFSYGFAKVRKGNRENYIDKTGKILSSVWFKECEPFYHGEGVVKMMNGDYRTINSKGVIS